MTKLKPTFDNRLRIRIYMMIRNAVETNVEKLIELANDAYRIDSEFRSIVDNFKEFIEDEIITTTNE